MTHSSPCVLSEAYPICHPRGRAARRVQNRCEGVLVSLGTQGCAFHKIWASGKARSQHHHSWVGPETSRAQRLETFSKANEAQRELFLTPPCYSSTFLHLPALMS